VRCDCGLLADQPTGQSAAELLSKGATMTRLVALGAALVALSFAGSTAAAPTAPTGEAGACNMVNSGAMHGMGTAVDNANSNGVDGMIGAIENTTPYGPPDFCPNP
jgi:hypothetical protein